MLLKGSLLLPLPETHREHPAKPLLFSCLMADPWGQSAGGSCFKTHVSLRSLPTQYGRLMAVTHQWVAGSLVPSPRCADPGAQVQAWESA